MSINSANRQEANKKTSQELEWAEGDKSEVHKKSAQNQDVKGKENNFKERSHGSVNKTPERE